jgi:hypothetical protein
MPSNNLGEFFLDIGKPKDHYLTNKVLSEALFIINLEFNQNRHSIHPYYYY